jgi:hypothetical protein
MIKEKEGNCSDISGRFNFFSLNPTSQPSKKVKTQEGKEA